MIKREDFKQIIKLRSFWKIDRRRGNYELPDGSRLSSYVDKLVEQQMDLDGIRIAADGNLELAVYKHPNWVIMPPFEENEICSFEEQCRRVDKLVREMIG